MSAPKKRPPRLSPPARASYQLGRQVIEAETAKLDAVLAEATSRRDVISALQRNQKAISLSDNRVTDMRRYAAFRRLQGYPVTERWLKVIASCVAWEFDADATAREADAKRYGKAWDRAASKARRLERIKLELRRLAPEADPNLRFAIAADPPRLDRRELGQYSEFTAADWHALADFHSSGRVPGLGSFHPHDVSDAEFAVMLRERKARMEARRRANMTPDEKVAAQHANTRRKRERARELKGREGAGTKRIAETCGVSERAVRNWKANGVLEAKIKHTLGEIAFSRLMDEIGDEQFFRFPSRAYSEVQTRDTKRQSFDMPGRASSPSRVGSMQSTSSTEPVHPSLVVIKGRRV